MTFFLCSFQPVLKRSIIKFDTLQLHGVVASCLPAGSKFLLLAMTGALLLEVQWDYLEHLG